MNLKNHLFFAALVFAMVSQTAAQSGRHPAGNENSSISGIVSVTDFGARGDGIQNDAPAIQKALDSGAETVNIPKGVYIIGNTLLTGSCITIKADQEAVIRLANNAGNHVSVFLLANKNPGNGNNHIKVEGGIWDSNNEHNHRGKDGDMYAYTGAAINFVNVGNLVLRNLTIRNPDAFSIRLGEVEDFLVEDIVLDHSVVRPNQDGVHVGGFSRRGIIRRISAVHPDTPNDDMVAINADDDVERVINLGMRRGPISDILVEDIQADGAYNFVRLLSKDSRIDNITVRNVKGSCRYYAVNINNWRFPVGVGDIRNVRLENFNVTKKYQETSASKSLIHITLGISDLFISDFLRGKNESTNQAPTLLLSNGRENIVTFDGIQQKDSEFSISEGDIKSLWINRWFSFKP